MDIARRFAALFVFAAFSLSAQPPEAAKRAYVTRCAGCHGDDGSGGGHGPGFLSVRRTRVTDRQSVFNLIRQGIPDAAMPAFPLPAAELNLITDYVMFLKAPAAHGAAPAADGDATAGERYFAGTGRCATCHMVRGVGGILGPDLSNLASERKSGEIEDALESHGDPAPTRPVRGRRNAAHWRPVAVRLTNGQSLRSILKSESAFDVHLLTTSGDLRLLEKSQVARITPEPALIPRITAAPGESRDLLAYLTRLTIDPKSPRTTTAALGAGVAFHDIAHPAAGSWPSYHGQLGGNRFSPLDQINKTNIGQLAPKWMFPLPGAPKSLQVTPVVAGGIMYVTSVNEAYALDPRTGREIWHWSRPRTPSLAGDAASGINRGVAVLGDRVFLVTDNAHLLSLHRLTGQLIWEVEMADSRENYGATGAPLIVGDLVISGISGGDEGARGFLDAYRASTGERVWRFWTVPSPDQPGGESWSGDSWKHGCGTTWLTGTYDSDSKLLYWPTGNPCPDYDGDVRKGDNLYTSSVVALDPATGKLRWHFQFTPHDVHDWDATENPMLVDAPWHGKPRKLLLLGNRNGFFYVLDRITGEFLQGTPFVGNITWASGIDAKGLPILLPNNVPTADGQRTCPSVAGATNWTSTAFNPALGYYYLFTDESCSIYSLATESWKAGQSYYGGATRRVPGEGTEKSLKALDIQTGKQAFEIPNVGGGILASGLMATAGGLIFYGDGQGAFVAADSGNGKLLWHFNTAQQWKAGPMTYSIGGTQYVAIAAGNTIVSFSLR
ncbi:MAG: PQQ-binding-like beta-propeller repeat protein [Acidobacteriota bacterium]